MKLAFKSLDKNNDGRIQFAALAVYVKSANLIQINNKAFPI